MAFKDFNRNLSFADLELVGVLEKNRTQGFLEEINRNIDWGSIQEALHQEYPVGQSTFGLRPIGSTTRRAIRPTLQLRYSRRCYCRSGMASGS
jgi:hypothetical protein